MRLRTKLSLWKSKHRRGKRTEQHQKESPSKPTSEQKNLDEAAEKPQEVTGATSNHASDQGGATTNVVESDTLKAAAGMQPDTSSGGKSAAENGPSKKPAAGTTDDSTVNAKDKPNQDADNAASTAAEPMEVEPASHEHAETHREEPTSKPSSGEKNVVEASEQPQEVAEASNHESDQCGAGNIAESNALYAASGKQLDDTSLEEESHAENAITAPLDNPKGDTQNQSAENTSSSEAETDGLR